MIKYKQGDLFDYVKQSTQNTVLFHCCNNQGGWGKGFVLDLSKHFPKTEANYRRWFHGEKELEGCRMTGKPELGEVQFVEVRLGDTETLQPYTLTVCNMIAQNGYTVEGFNRAFDYAAFEQCLKKCNVVFKQAQKIICPLVGAGLAGGDWRAIAPIIEKYLGEYDTTVVVLNKGALPPEYQDKIEV